MTTRSGFTKFLIAVPSAKNSGIETIVNKGAKELLEEFGWTRPTQGDMNQMSAALLRLGAKRDRQKKFLIQRLPRIKTATSTQVNSSSTP